MIRNLTNKQLENVLNELNIIGETLEKLNPILEILEFESGQDKLEELLKQLRQK